ncbi:helix-turn-helix domain-containing protein [Streptomyces sp. NPDC058653]|uniref:helix-turn-helix domain-containing protein n=1 Tax=Streptomyces sp. NPDC058653 TaxID=3346576 RepID=UPI00365551CD
MKSPNRTCSSCGSGLSKYNSARTCAPCSRLRRVPDRAWRDREVHHALATWEFGDLVRRLRQRSGLSQTDVSELTGLAQSFISALESGRKRLGSPEVLIDFLNGLDLPTDLKPLLLSPFKVADPQSPDVLDPALPWTVDRMVTSLETAAGGSTVKRRRALTALSGASITHWVLQSAVASTEQVAAPASGGTVVTPPFVDALQSVTDGLRQMDASSGSGDLADTARPHLKLLLGLMKRGKYDERTGRHLAAVIADTAIQTGWYTFDGGSYEEAEGFFLGALRAAHASGDMRLKAGALSYLAIHGYSVGNPHTAVSAARTARQLTSDQDSPSLHAMLLTRQARGHARLGEERRARAALDEARILCDRGGGEDDPHWLYWVNPGEILGQKGSCYLDLGQPAKAVAAFTEAREFLKRDETRTHAQFLSRAATAQLRAGDADAGCATGQEVLSLVDGVRSARLDDHLYSMLREARHFNDAAPAQSFLERGRTILKERRVI